MGSLCATPAEIRPSRVRKSIIALPGDSSPISNESKLLITPNSFVFKNITLFSDMYILEDSVLGHGARGEVRLCTHKLTHDCRVVKIISKSRLPPEIVDSNSVFDEVNILKTLDHPNLPRFYEFFEDHLNYYIVMEYCQGGDLFRKITEVTKFEESQAAEIMSQILSGVNYLHSKGILHRDLKLANILLEDKNSLNLKIIDFDAATFFGKDYYKEMMGTVLFMAPEVVTGMYNEKCDLWSCGIILYVLLSGKSPITGKEASMLKKIPKIQIKLDEPIWGYVSPEAKNLLNSLLQLDPKKRISAADACVHPWIKRYKKRGSKKKLSTIISNIKDFKRTSKLKEAIHVFIISKVLDRKLYRDEDLAFRILDKDKSGAISRDELIETLISNNIKSAEVEELAEKIMEEVDTDRDGFINYTEFLRASISSKTVFTKKNLLQAFQAFDQDGNGEIDVEELEKYLCGNKKITIELLNEIIGQADMNNDGRINLEEFEKLLAENIEASNT